MVSPIAFLANLAKCKENIENTELKRLDVGEDRRQSVRERLEHLFSQLDSDFSADRVDY